MTSSREKSVTGLVHKRTTAMSARATYGQTRPRSHARERLANRGRARARPGQPGRDEEEDPGRDHRPEGAAEQLREDVPGIRRRGAVLGLAHERVHDVVAHEPEGEQPDDADGEQRRADPPDDAPAIAGEPDDGPEGEERQQGQDPRERLQQLRGILGGVEVVGFQDLDDAGVLRDPLGEIAADPDAIRSLDDELTKVERDDAALGRHRVRSALEYRDESPVRLP